MNHAVAPVHRFTLFVFLAVANLGCEQVSEVASGAGSATKNLADTISGNGSSKKDDNGPDGATVADDEVSGSPESSQSASGTIGESEPDQEQESGADDASDDEPESFATGPRSGDFDLVFEQSYQSCDSCGIWFDSAEIVIEHSEGRFSARQSGSLLIKEAPYHQGRFKADISAIPRSAEIRSAILYMHLNRDEGISNDDFTSRLSAFGYVDGSLTYLREITAENDIKGRGYSKANPVVPIDFTEYARQI